MATIDVVLNTIAAIVGVILLGVIIWFLWTYKSYKIRVRIREIVKGRTVVRDDKAKLVKDRHKIRWWKFYKHRERIPEPPSDSVDIDHKGRKVVEFYKTGDGQYIPLIDSFDYETWLEDNRSTWQPYTTQQRALLVNEHSKAEDYKRKSIADVISSAFPYVAAVMIITVFLLFFGEAVQPMQEVGNQMSQVAEAQADITRQLNDIVNQRVVLGGENSGGAPPE